jgi:hypothetical protein
MNRKIEISYDVHYEYHIDETLEITDRLLSELGLDENATDEEIIDAIADNGHFTSCEYFQGHNYVGIIDHDNTPQDVDIELGDNKITNIEVR